MILVQIVVLLQALAIHRGVGFLIVSFGLSGTLLALSMIDLQTLRLPDVLTLPLIPVGVALAAVKWAGHADLLDRLVGAAVGWASLAALAWGFRRLTGRDGLGLGDAKLLAGAGAWLGWRSLPFVVLMACLAAFVWLAIRRLKPGAHDWHAPLPFGPPLTLAFWLTWLYGAPFSSLT